VFDVRAARAYLASFGTMGSLLAGAVLLFALASAFVAFNGWPEVGDSATPASVVLTKTSKSDLAPGRVKPSAVSAAAAGTGASAVTPTTLLSRSGSSSRLRTRGVTGGNPGGLVTQVTGTLGSAVGSTGKTVAQAVSGAADTVGGVAPGTAGQTVQGAGQTAGNVAGGVTGSVGGTVTSTGQGAGGLLGGMGH
jgi:hypothetical protein